MSAELALSTACASSACALTAVGSTSAASSPSSSRSKALNAASLGLTTHDTPQHNGVAESLNRRLMERVRALLHRSGLPPELWAEALQFIVWVKNRTLTKVLGNVMPFEKLTGRKPNLAGVPEWGQRVWAHTPANSKLGARDVIARWVGYDEDNTHAHRIYWPGQHKDSVERDVHFTASTTTIPIPSALPAPHTPTLIAPPPSTAPAPSTPTQAASAPQQPPAATSSGEEEIEVEDELSDSSPPPVARSRSALQLPGAPKKSRTGQAAQSTRQSSRVRKPSQYVRKLTSGEGTAGGLLEPRPPSGVDFPRLKPGQGEAMATGTNAPCVTYSTDTVTNYNSSNQQGAKHRDRHGISHTSTTQETCDNPTL